MDGRIHELAAARAAQRPAAIAPGCSEPSEPGTLEEREAALLRDALDVMEPDDRGLSYLAAAADDDGRLASLLEGIESESESAPVSAAESRGDADV